MKSQTQKSLLFAFVASIAACGLIGIYCLLKGDIGDLEARVLGTTAAVGGASILALASAIPWERKRWQPIGPVGIAVVTITLVQMLCLIWLGKYSDLEFLLKALGVSCTFSVAVPHIGLLSLARLQRQYEWVRVATIAAISLLAGIVSLLIITEAGEYAIVQVIGTLAILDVCGTITVPILHRVSAVNTVDAIHSATREVSLTCPRCAKPNKRLIGRSGCPHCGLIMNIEIEEEHCAKCGYVLYGTTSADCPECGAPIGATNNAAK